MFEASGGIGCDRRAETGMRHSCDHTGGKKIRSKHDEYEPCDRQGNGDSREQAQQSICYLTKVRSHGCKTG